MARSRVLSMWVFLFGCGVLSGGVVGCDGDSPSSETEAPGSPTATTPEAGDGDRPAARGPTTRPRIARPENGIDRGPSPPIAPDTPVPTEDSTPPADGTSFQPLRDAVAGEYARYSAADGREVSYLVEAVTTERVETQVTVFDQGKPLGLPALRVDDRDVDPLARQAARSKATVTRHGTTIDAAGRSWKTVCHEHRWVDEEVTYVRRTWVSPKMPVFGTVRMELRGDGVLEAKLELLEAGGP